MKNPNFISDVQSKIREWVRYNVGFSRAVLFLLGLILTESLVDYALVSVLITYSTDTWNMDLPQATTTVNVTDIIQAVLGIFMQYGTHSYFGVFKVVLSCSMLYLLGLILFTIEVFKRGRLFYIALGAIVMGKVGLTYPFKDFVADQFKKEGNDETQAKIRRDFWWSFASLLGIITAIFTFLNAGWKSFSIISTILMGVACIVFFVGCCIRVYYCSPPSNTKSPFLLASRVFNATRLKMGRVFPNNPCQVHHETTGDPLPLDTNRFRCSRPDKAAIVESSTFMSTVMQKIKSLLQMLYMSMPFVVYGLVKSAGNTFFMEQGNNMNSGALLFLLYVIQSFSTYASSKLYDLISKWFPESIQKYSCAVRIGVGLFFSIFCCCVAWKIEAKRVSMVENQSTDMSIFWLVPQFCLLGITIGLAEDGLEEFSYNNVSASFREYGPPLKDLRVAFENFLSIIFVNAVHSWFGDSIDNSTLDEYYRMLTILTYVNFFFFCFIASKYTYGAVEKVELKEILIEKTEEIAEEIIEEDVVGASTDEVELKTAQEEEANE